MNPFHRPPLPPRKSNSQASRPQISPHPGEPLSPDRSSEIIASVNRAVRESEAGPLPPPRRGESSKRWTVDILSESSTHCYAMIILNQPIDRKDVFFRAWNNSQVRMCADGGANRLYDLLDDSQRPSFLPDCIKGDLDSIRPDVQQYYASRGVNVKHDPDQYSTDLMKCIVEVETEERQRGTKFSLLLLGGLSGRVDQTVHTMALLHKRRKHRSDTFVLSGDSLAWVIDSGSHSIEIRHDVMGETCGLLPVGVASSHVKTSGLKWDVDWTTSFDGDISTSNHLLPSEPVVTIHTSQPILWCVEIQPHLPRSSGSPINTTAASPSDLQDLLL